MKKRVDDSKLFVALIFFMLFVLIFSFGDVSAVSEIEEIDDEPGFFGKFWSFFKGLFGGGKDIDVSPDEVEDFSVSVDNFPDDDYSSSEFDNNIQIILQGPTKIGINDLVIYVGGVMGTDSCTLNEVVLDDCSSFVQSFNFGTAGTYNITLVAGEETKTIVLVVEEDFVYEVENVTEEEGVDSINIILVGPQEVYVDEPAVYMGMVVGADNCTLNGVVLEDCSSFTESLVFGVAGTYTVTLVAGGKAEIRILVVRNYVEGGSVEEESAPMVDINEVPNDDGSVDSNGWPAYLNVPEYCPGPEEGEHYKFYWPLYSGNSIPSVGPVRFGAPGHVSYTMLRDMPGSVWSNTVMGMNEVYSMPIYSGNTDSWGVVVLGSINQDMMQGAISECPGDFDRADGNPDKGCSYPSISSMAMWSASTSPVEEVNRADGKYDNRCTLEPGKRYFINAKWTEGADTYPFCRSPVCWAQTTYASSFYTPSSGSDNYRDKPTYPPYIGPCLDNPPYPPNYHRSECVNPTRNYDQYGDGRCVETNSDLGKAEGSTRTWTCRDGADGEVLVEYVFTCLDGKYRVTSGEDVPATPNMVCIREEQPKPYTDAPGCRVVSYRQPEPPFTGSDVFRPVGSKYYVGSVNHRDNNYDVSLYGVEYEEYYTVGYSGYSCRNTGTTYGWVVDGVGDYIKFDVGVTLGEIYAQDISFKQYLPVSPVPGEDAKRYTYE